METKTNEIRILIVDDEPDIREILQFNLENEGYTIDMAESAEDAEKVLTDKHRLILLDVMMGGISGFRFAEKLRKGGNDVPIIFLTAKDTENDMLTGFSIGGDDYIAKPFSIKEVIARVKTVLKRSSTTKKALSSNLITIDTLAINHDSKEVRVDGELIELTKTEFKILVLLIENETKIFSRSDILDKVWDNEIVLERTVDVHIARLRRKLGEYGNRIINRTGYGYSFAAE